MITIEKLMVHCTEKEKNSFRERSLPMQNLKQLARFLNGNFEDEDITIIHGYLPKSVLDSRFPLSTRGFSYLQRYRISQAIQSGRCVCITSKWNYYFNDCTVYSFDNLQYIVLPL